MLKVDNMIIGINIVKSEFNGYFLKGKMKWECWNWSTLTS